MIEDKPFEVWVEVQNARGVTPGQGQTVRVAGMRVGDVGEVKLEDGKALVRMDLDTEYDDLVRRDATVLLRPRTGLKDMFLALDPGTPHRPAVKEGGVIDSANTLPDVNADEVLAGAGHRHALLPRAADQRSGQGARRAATTTCARCSPGSARCTATSTCSTPRWSSASATSPA